MSPHHHRFRSLALPSLLASTLLPALLALPGCGGKILRENVLATTQSTFGLTLAQNVQTQAYEFKLGYARNEFFLVPTSKRVINDPDNHDAAGSATTTTTTSGNPPQTTTETKGYVPGVEHNDPTGTPEVLAEIQVGGSGKQGLGAGGSQGGELKVYQRLAVGRIAVQSGAAIALMSQDAQTAKAVAGPQALITTQPEYFAAVRLAFNALQTLAAEGNAPAKQALARLDSAAQAVTPPVYPFRIFDESTPNAYTSRPASPDQLKTAPITVPLRDASRPAAAQDLIDYAARLEDSIRNLDNLLSRNAGVTLNAASPNPRELRELQAELERMREQFKALNAQLDSRGEIAEAMQLMFSPPAPK